MKNKHFNLIIATILITILSTPALAAGVVNKKKQKEDTSVPIVGKTADGKYNVYDLRGDLDDFKYYTSVSTVYGADDLVGNMGYLSYKDAKSPAYQCDMVCKDKAGHIVGLNPTRAPLYHMESKVPKN